MLHCIVEHHINLPDYDQMCELDTPSCPYRKNVQADEYEEGPCGEKLTPPPDRNITQAYEAEYEQNEGRPKLQDRRRSISVVDEVIEGFWSKLDAQDHQQSSDQHDCDSAND